MAHLLLAGGGHVHLAVLKDLAGVTRRGHAVSLVTPSRWHYYSGMGPGLLGGTYAPRELRFDVAAMAEAGGGRCHIGHVARIEPAARRVVLEDGRSLGYDLLSVNLGSRVELPGVVPNGRSIFAAKPIEQLAAAHERLEALFSETGVARVLVVGGGAAGVELAGNVLGLAALRRAGVEVRLLAGSGLMSGAGARTRRLAAASLADRGAIVLPGARLAGVEGLSAHLQDGSTLAFDLILLAMGARMPGLLAAAGLAVDGRGAMVVNRYLQCPEHPEIFGGGDCVHFAPEPLDKVGVYAVREAPVLARNLAAALDGRPLTPFRPGSRGYLLLYNPGDGTAICAKYGLVLSGRWAFWLKDAIDRRFVRAFQVSGEAAG